VFVYPISLKNEYFLKLDNKTIVFISMNGERNFFFTVCKYTCMTRVVIERLRIILVPLPVLYNHTNHLASMFCGPDMHSFVFYLLSIKL